jgi:biopolymer transport protein ExbD
MAFEYSDKNDEVMCEINMTPLVDVMLVLLIIFMITVPLITNSLNIVLPKAQSYANSSSNSSVRLSIDGVGNYFWNDVLVSDEKLIQLLAIEASLGRQTNIQLFADKDVRYERVAQLMAQVQHAGLTQIGLVTLATQSQFK